MAQAWQCGGVSTSDNDFQPVMAPLVDRRGIASVFWRAVSRAKPARRSNSIKYKGTNFMIDPALSKEFLALYTQWGDAIANKQHDWIEDLFTEDFLGTAHPWPTLRVDKRGMIDLDKAIETMETKIVKLEAQRIGDEVLTVMYGRYLNEVFREGSTIGEGMPTGSQIAALTKGKVAVYTNGWRHNGTRWQCYDHHLVAVIEDKGFD
jgi:hypothetical protein